MKKLFFALLIALTLYNVYLCSVSALNGEVNFFNDVARDFLLLQELDHKKIVLIGPRSSTAGLFHGPAWTYINYPAYLLGNGNPVVVAWFWLLLEVGFLIACFFIAKKLFGIVPALFYVLILSARMIPHVNGIFHSEATFFILPFFFFTMERYLATKKNAFLALHFLITAILIQLEIGDGIPFFALSCFVALWFIIRNKLWNHLLSFLVIPLFLINLILFDIKHQFRMLTAIISTGTGQKYFMPINDWIRNRIENIISLELLDQSGDYLLILFIIFIAVVFVSYREIKRKTKLAPVYRLFMFYYFGYMAFSYFNKGTLLYHYIYLLIPLTTLWLVSLIRGKYMYVFGTISVFIYLLTLSFGNTYLHGLKESFINKNPNSWRGLSSISEEIIKRQNGREFGYYVYSPDAYAYQPRYAMLYNFKTSHAKAYEYQKKETTYVIAQQPPADNPYMSHEWWIEVPVGIKAKPVFTKKLSNGYTILEYHLTPEEQKIPHDKTIELGISFR